MKKAQTLFEQGGHRWVAIARDPDRADYVIDTNEYLIIDGDDCILTDPGGLEIFPAVFAAVSAAHDVRTIHRVFASHQDPDVISSLALWLEWNPGIKCYLSWLWATFIPHFGGRADTFVHIPDEGMQIPLGKMQLEALPAHYLHSSGNFHLYDPLARILFTGDIGAALLPPTHTSLFVTDFEEHLQYIAGFHRRWMGSREARDAWCQRVSDMGIDMLCPQHGAIYRGPDVARFIDWFSELKLGVLSKSGRKAKSEAA